MWDIQSYIQKNRERSFAWTSCLVMWEDSWWIWSETTKTAGLLYFPTGLLVLHWLTWDDEKKCTEVQSAMAQGVPVMDEMIGEVCKAWSSRTQTEMSARGFNKHLIKPDCFCLILLWGLHLNNQGEISVCCVCRHMWSKKNKQTKKQSRSKIKSQNAPMLGAKPQSLTTELNIPQPGSRLCPYPHIWDMKLPRLMENNKVKICLWGFAVVHVICGVSYVLILRV